MGEVVHFELRRQGQRAAPEASDAGLVGRENPVVEETAAEGQVRNGGLPGAIGGREREGVGVEVAGGYGAVGVCVDVDTGLVSPVVLAAGRPGEVVAHGRAAGEHVERGGVGRVQRSERPAEADGARSALRPDEVAPGVEDELHGLRRRADGKVHQVLRVGDAVGVSSRVYAGACGAPRGREQPRGAGLAARGHAVQQLAAGEAAAAVRVVGVQLQGCRIAARKGQSKQRQPENHLFEREQ